MEREEFQKYCQDNSQKYEKINAIIEYMANDILNVTADIIHANAYAIYLYTRNQNDIFIYSGCSQASNEFFVECKNTKLTKYGPLFLYMSEKKMPAHNNTPVFKSMWQNSPISELFAEKNLKNVLAMPLLYKQQLVASINCARNNKAFSDSELQKCLHLARLLSSSLAAHENDIRSKENTNMYYEILEDVISDKINKHTMVENFSFLSPRECEVFEELLKGLTNKEMGEKLFVSENTIKQHLKNIYNKFGVQSRSQLLACAFVDAISK
jgi:DNA-binding CsgD family transcriptional regulator